MAEACREGRRAAHRLPLRADPRGPALRPPALAPRRRGDLPGLGRADRLAAGGDGDRRRLHVVRADAPTDRARPVHPDPELDGQHPAAGRGRRRGAGDRRGLPRRDAQPRLRRRRAGAADVPRAAGALRHRRRAAPTADPGAVRADQAGRPGRLGHRPDADARPCWPSSTASPTTWSAATTTWSPTCSAASTSSSGCARPSSARWPRPATRTSPAADLQVGAAHGPRLGRWLGVPAAAAAVRFCRPATRLADVLLGVATSDAVRWPRRPLLGW